MSTHSERIGARLRRIRQQQQLSLADVEHLSGGRWKAVVVGAYERGDRAVTIARLSSLAEFYEVPLADLLPGARREESVDGDTRIVLDLTTLSADAPAPVDAVARFARQVQQARGDYNGRVLSLRASDLETLALTTQHEPEVLLARLREHGALATVVAG